MTSVVFETYNIKTQAKSGGGEQVFDIIRRKWVELTPEEWVRQHVLQYLVYTRKYSRALIAVEKMIQLNTLQKRFDAVVFTSKGDPYLLIECKAPEVLLNSSVLEQAARYNQTIQAQYLWISNGLQNVCIQLGASPQIMETIPLP